MSTTDWSSSAASGGRYIALAVLCSAAVGFVLVRSHDVTYALALPALILIATVVRSVLLIPLVIYILALFFDDTYFLDIGSGPKWLGMLAAASLGLRLLLTRARPRLSRTAIWLMSLLFWALLTMLWSINSHGSQASFMTLAGVMLTTILIGVTEFTKVEEGVVRDAVVIGGVGAALFALHFGSSQWLETGDLTVRLGLDRLDQQFGVNPNGLALSLLLPIALSACGIFAENRPVRQVWSWCAFVTMTAALVLTQSRGGFLAFGALLLSLALQLKLKVARGRFVLVAASLIIMFWFVASIISARFDAGAFWSGAGRDEIWRAGVRALADHWLIGAGVGTFPYAYRAEVLAHGGGRSGWAALDAHNVYLGLGVELGVIGLLLFGLAMRDAYRALRRAAHHGEISAPFVAAALVGTLVGSFFTTSIRAKWFWLTIALSMIAARGLAEPDRMRPERELAESRIAARRVRS